MADMALTFGTDLEIDATGDIAVSDGTQEGQERVIRRLLTNPQEYIWHPTYGAGIAQYLGQPTMAAQIQAVTRQQMSQEKAVAQTPPPAVTIASRPDNTVTLNIKYADGDTGQPVPLTVPITG